ncbi:hypothetical protein [Candidatus Nardonella dryophthoridicola]|uniref:RNase III domain-containing protein n=1 Tax=endosymbiont of Metamasius hemipterus TaxID=204627 RepID=A0ABT0TWM1_9GAMM|nr:hypothetical protein [Candidatus Nardonella dryophthoridicola]MCM0158294.1 hypothetical protein [endosymbiont of Metamasius hemipterus]
MKKKSNNIENSILSNSIEALIGAIFLDSNINKVEKIIKKMYSFFFINKNKIIKNNKDYKSNLQKFLQKKNTITYI